MPVAILSLCFSPLLDYCFIIREPWLPWKYLPERVNNALISLHRWFIVSVNCTSYSRQWHWSSWCCGTFSLFTCCSASQWVHMSFIFHCFGRKNIFIFLFKAGRLALNQEWISFIGPVRLKRPRLGGSLPAKALDHRETLTSWPSHVARSAKSAHLFLIEHQRRVVALIITGRASSSSSSFSFSPPFSPPGDFSLGLFYLLFCCLSSWVSHWRWLITTDAK